MATTEAVAVLLTDNGMGDTDPELYQRIVGRTADAVRAAA